MKQDLSSLDWLEQTELASREASDEGYTPPHDECVGIFCGKEVFVDDDNAFYTYQPRHGVEFLNPDLKEFLQRDYDNAATRAAYEEFDNPEMDLQAAEDCYY